MIRGASGRNALNLFSNFKWVMCARSLDWTGRRNTMILSGPFLVSRTGDAG